MSKYTCRKSELFDQIKSGGFIRPLQFYPPSSVQVTRPSIHMYLVACSTHPSQRKSARAGKAWELSHHLVSISIFVKLFTFYAQVQMWKIIVLYKVAVGRFVGGKKFSVENLCWENSQENRCCMCEMRGISCS